MVTNKKQIKELAIYPEWCKGCGVCVEFCPKGALKLDSGKIVIANLKQCAKCGICEKLCPDYAIYFIKSDSEENENND